MTRRMFRYSVPVTDETSTFNLTGDPVTVSAAADDVVEFWAEHDEDAPEVKRTFLVVGTGHPIPAGAVWMGTCPRTPLGMVWHLYEVTQ